MESILSLKVTFSAAWTFTSLPVFKSVPILYTLPLWDFIFIDPPLLSLDEWDSVDRFTLRFVLNQFFLTLTSSRVVTLSWIVTSSLAVIFISWAAFTSVAVSVTLPSSDMTLTLPHLEVIFALSTVEYEPDCLFEVKNPLFEDEVLWRVSIGSMVIFFWAFKTTILSPETDPAVIESEPLSETTPTTLSALISDEVMVTSPWEDRKMAESPLVILESLTLKEFFDSISSPLSNFICDWLIATDFALRSSWKDWSMLHLDKMMSWSVTAKSSRSEIFKSS